MAIKKDTDYNRRTIKLTAEENNWILTDFDKQNGRMRYEKDGFCIEIYPSTLSMSVKADSGKPRWFKKAKWFTISRLFFAPWISTKEATAIKAGIT